MTTKSQKTCRLCFCVLFGIAVIVLIVYIKARLDERPTMAKPVVPVMQCTSSSGSDREILSAKLRTLSNSLVYLQRKLYTSSKHFNALGNQVKIVEKMLNSLQHDRISDTDALFKREEVCPEKFDSKALADSAPYYHIHSSHIDCRQYVPIQSLITILIYLPDQPSKPGMDYAEILQGVGQYYPNMKVLLATNKELPKAVMNSIPTFKVSLQHMTISGQKGSMWENMLNLVETPYVLIAPYITHFDNDVDLYRLVRILSNHKDVAVAGGSFRNLTGHWDLGCQQTSFNYWTAKYTAGYYRSLGDCVVCDYLPGPFAAKTSLLKKIEFDTSLSEGVFLDLFWRLQRLNSGGNKAVVCADVMFNIATPRIKDAALVTLAAKHDIKKMVNSDGTVRWYGCKRGLSYTKGKSCEWPDGIGAPPCDLWNLGEAVKFIMLACEEAKVPCEYAAGNVLGAVKFASVIPWEKDADIHFHTNNFSVFNKLRGKFERAGYSFSADSSGLGGFSISTTKWRLSMYGRKSLEVGDMIAQGKRPTRVPMSGAWVTVPRNPGMFARNHYVTNYFQHAEHHGGDSFYNAGRFKKCPIEDHSACLDQYPADGNLQFLDYLP